jgi:mono/diheme cytochrome c family protein
MRKVLSGKNHGALLSLLVLFALGAAACGGKAGPQSGEVQRGAELFISRNCVTCHGAGGEGRPTGPSLLGLAEHYDVDGMVEYLKNPDAVLQRDARLRERAEGIGALMPRYNYLPDEELRDIATYVLSLE